MKKLKVMTIVGTRPEIIRLSEVIKLFDKLFDHILVHTGQNWNYNLNEIFFKDLKIRKPDYFLNSAGKNLGQTLGNILSKSYDVFLKEKPDALLILGDTNSALSAIPAKRLKIPIFHMEAGNRCFDENVPEEINRRIVDHISDVNLPYTENSRYYLLMEGIKKEYIFVTGSPMTEVIWKNLQNIKKSKILNELKLKNKKYILLSSHREENIDIDKNFDYLTDSIDTVAENYRLPIIFSTHPRTLKKLNSKKRKLHKLVKIYKPFGFFDYINLEMNSFCVLSDSGTLSEESAILGFPAVLIRTSTERPEAVDKGTIILGGIDKEGILRAINMATSLRSNNIPYNYIDEDVSEKVAKIIEGYTKIINKNIWNKSQEL
ncbi:MAG: UDP-N-acetylglucosamine 2-epimerase (non-hydrolyzing) [candidate division WOR-3 bacterium]